MTKIKDIVRELEQWAPLPYQESYDNAGLILGNAEAEVRKVLLCIDVTLEIIEEAVQAGAQLVIAHHPLIFRSLKRITPQTDAGQSIIKAIRHDVGIYAIHTNVDNILGGVNSMLAEKLGLRSVQILQTKNHILAKLTSFVPSSHTTRVLAALYEAGAGQIGNYDGCSFRTTGTGTFRPGAHANPFIGSPNEVEEVSEDRIEVILPKHKTPEVLRALQHTHPYEEAAYYLHDLANAHSMVGSGVIGTLENPISPMAFMNTLKQVTGIPYVRHSAIVREKVQKIGLCGGAGGFLIGEAQKQQADVFVTADLKYHDFFSAENSILLVDAGHYETEQFTKELIFRKLSEKFANIALHLTEVNTNPVYYT